MLQDTVSPRYLRFFWRWLQLLLFITSALVTIDVDGQICHFYSQGFVLSQILSVLKRRNPLENHASNTMGTNAFCWSYKQSRSCNHRQKNLRYLGLTVSWSSNRIFDRPINGWEISSSVFGQTRCTRLYLIQIWKKCWGCIIPLPIYMFTNQLLC